MGKNYQVTLVLLLGIAIGSILGSALHAQSTPAYAIVDISEVTDPDTYGSILTKAPAGLLAFGGRYLARSENLIALDGAAPKRFVLIAFDSLDKARRWSASPPVKEITSVRKRSTLSRSFIVEGFPH